MATNYDQDLLNLVGNSEDMQRKQREIDILANNMKPVAGTSEGVFALQDLLANPMAPKEQRAAAAQALHPGIKATIGSFGELSFSNAPGADLSTNYASNARPSTSAQLKAQGGKTSIAIDNFDSQFTAIHGMTDSVDVMNTYASLQSSAVEYINSKQATIKNQIEQSMGINSLRAELETSMALDREHFNTYYGGENQGPTQETLGIIQLLNSKQVQADQEVSKRLSTDPELVGLQAKLKTLDSFVSDKYNSLQDSSKLMGMDMIPPEQVQATAIAMGSDTSNPMNLRKIQEGIVSGNTVINKAQQVGMAPPTQLVGLAAFGDGVTSVQARRVLASKLTEKSSVDLIINKVKNFDTEYPDVIAARKDEFTMGKRDETGSPTAKAEAQATIQARKVQYVLEDIQSERTKRFVEKIGEWQAPQDERLSEVPVIIGDLNSVGEPFTLDTVIQRMDWTGGDRAQKIKAMTQYINSQAGSLEDNAFFGAPTRFANPAMTEQHVQSLVIYKERNSQYGRAAQSFLNPQGRL